MADWQPIETAPKEPRAPGWAAGPLIYLKPTWGGWDVGYWSISENCFRFCGDDGPDDEQPTHWQPLPEPPKE